MHDGLLLTKTYRAPRRRPAHLRTKTGCLTCRTRKKKCDEAPGTCNNCARGDFECTWPPNRDELKKDQSSANTSDISSPSSPIPTKARTLVPLKPLPPLARALSFSSDIRIPSAPLFDFMRLIFLPHLVRPTIDAQYRLDHTRRSMQMAHSSPASMDALLACSGAENPQKDFVRGKLAEFHYNRAVAGLRVYLTQESSTEVDIIALQTVMLLCIYERSKLLLSQDVETHLYGASALIKSCYHRMRKATTIGDTWRPTRVLALEAFILHGSTSIPFQGLIPRSPVINEAFAMAQDILELEQELDNGYFNSPVLGTPPQIFAFVRQVSLLHRQFQIEGPDIQECLAVEASLVRWAQQHFPHVFTVDSHDEQISDEATAPDSSGEVENLALLPTGSRRTTETLIFKPNLYLLSSRILLRHMIAAPFPQRDTCLSNMLSQAMSLIRCIDPVVDYFADTYSWPFYAVGVSLVDPDDRKYLIKLILAYWTSRDNATMRRLANMLTETWSLSGGWSQ